MEITTLTDAPADPHAPTGEPELRRTIGLAQMVFYASGSMLGPASTAWWARRRASWGRRSGWASWWRRWRPC
uniref:Uncharacterized protein n=1 Tax=Phenylobacterium glaciei TaxID=2803784 RepID=A0A974P1W1_9CAUL|nr:hypothetical protein JKL49_23050 [Phenylobacterium glaciei]